MKPIEIQVAETRPGAESNEGTGAFFSLGVDSFDTMSRRSELTHLVMVKGFDISRLHNEMWDRIFDNARRVAGRTGLQLAEVTSNVRDLGRYQIWSFLHGPALAAAAHVLTGHIGTVFVSSSFPYDRLEPWGTHPLTDPLWSSESLEVVHFGADRSRIQKLSQLADDESVLESLRVCLAGESRDYNCGECSKCLMAMAILAANGRLRDCATLPDEVDLRLLARMDLGVMGRRDLFDECIELLEGSERDPKLLRALKRGVFRYRVKRVLSALG